ncbi:PfkB family carbohydrate kinase [Helcobacillus massiliensis]|uniref:PfkB family carbohydrate kinase n=1 Tax=Helcobacillus massiliensis TaxID=521392 RepID=UPI002556E21B|nr:PfkB family carbohydrate kinase [Helcobacillus massiliensis]MDK7741855.1 PfkB family carbohydrate kinase [Helcobacillus massiliensis]WOO92954.1 PfkB family carbohydrate kinase [Helcobacillus massiliensis]
MSTGTTARPQPTERPARVLHTAQALVDVTIPVPHLPRRGQNANATAMPQYAAGGAVTILVAAARTGATAVHGGAHGTGPNGDLIRAALAADGIRLSADPVPDEDTGPCFVFVEPSGERTFVTTYGAERRITAASLAALAPEPGDLVCVSGYSLFDPTREPLLEFLESLPSGVEIVLDPGAPFADFDEELRRRMLRLTTVWTSNADEAEGLVGAADDLHAIRDLIAGDVVIVRDGEKGCTVLAGGATVDVAGFPQTPVDTNGAGDTHTGILLAERALGSDWAAAAERANAGAALKVTRLGPASVPAREEVSAFLASDPPRSSID